MAIREGRRIEKRLRIVLTLAVALMTSLVIASCSSNKSVETSTY